jgi:hypothetical protein
VATLVGQCRVAHSGGGHGLGSGSDEAGPLEVGPGPARAPGGPGAWPGRKPARHSYRLEVGSDSARAPWGAQGQGRAGGRQGNHIVPRSGSGRGDMVWQSERFIISRLPTAARSRSWRHQRRGSLGPAVRPLAFRHFGSESRPRVAPKKRVAGGPVWRVLRRRGAGARAGAGRRGRRGAVTAGTAVTAVTAVTAATAVTAGPAGRGGQGRYGATAGHGGHGRPRRPPRSRRPWLVTAGPLPRRRPGSAGPVGLACVECSVE